MFSSPGFSRLFFVKVCIGFSRLPGFSRGFSPGFYPGIGTVIVTGTAMADVTGKAMVSSTSAIMAGMSVEIILCDQNGNIDLHDLKSKAELHSKNLSAM